MEKSSLKSQHGMRPFSVEQLLAWRETQKAEKSHDLPGFRLNSPVMGRRHIFLLDDSSSMRPYWKEVVTLLAGLTYFIKGADTNNGLQLQFTSTIWRYTSKNSSLLVNAAKRRDLRGTGDMESRLKFIFHQYSAASKSRFDPRLPWSIYVFTDGKWDDNTNPILAISSLIQDVQKAGEKAVPVGIQFIRFGEDLEGVHNISHLVQSLGQELDILDTTPANGDVWKILLGMVKEQHT